MEINNLAQALVLAQASMGTAPKNGYNPHFKSSFSTLEDLIEVSRLQLTKNGLAITQYPHSVEGHTFLVTKLKHVSGEEETSIVQIHLKDSTDIQKLGSAMSYLKRYAYASICGIATSEGDDDGNSNSNPSGNSYVSSTPAHATEVKSDAISVKQLGLLKAKIGNRPGIENSICKRYNISSLALLPWRNMNEVVGILDAQSNPKPVEMIEEDELPF